jgi:adenine phosphoribosyltransferase
MDLKPFVKTVPNWPRPGVNFLDISGILANPRALDHCISRVAHTIKHLDIDSVVAVESRGFLFAAGAAAQAGVPLILARKAGKLPGQCHTVTYDTEYSQDRLQMQTHAKPGSHVLIVDDLLATGGTILAVNQLLKDHWSVKSVSAQVIINLGFLPGQQNLADNNICLDWITKYE